MLWIRCRSLYRAALLLIVLAICGGSVQATSLHAETPARATVTVLPETPAPLAQPRCEITAGAWSATAGAEPAELIIVLAEQADLRPAYALTTQEARGRFVHDALLDLAQRSQRSLRQALDSQSIPYRPFYIVNALWVKVTREQMLSLADHPDVARIVANPWVQGTRPIAEAALSATATVTWSLPLIGATDVWAMGYTGQGVVVAGQDTGYEWEHPALKPQYRGWDGSTASHDYNWHDAIHADADIEDPPDGNPCGFDSPVPCDDNNHGTHTMGTMVGDSGGNPIGVAPGARWIGCRNMEEGWGSPATYMECFEFFLAPYPISGDPVEDGRPEMAPDVINNSWSCTSAEGCDWSTLQASVEAVEAAGILVVGSAGNYGSACSTVKEPIAIYGATLSVGATDSSDAIASFSSRGPVTVDGSGRLKPNLSAPGVYIYSSVRGGTYSTMSGTSMASPHVAGAAALVGSARPDLRGQTDAIRNLLTSTALPRYSTQCGDLPDAVPNNVYGWGRLDVRSAVEDALLAAKLDGTVRNTTGTPLAGAQIRATLSTRTWEATTTVGGAYELWPVSGTYTITASAVTYRATVVTGVSVSTGMTTTLDLVLEQERLYLPTVLRVSSQDG